MILQNHDMNVSYPRNEESSKTFIIPRRMFDGCAPQIPYLAGSSEIKDIRALFSAEVRLSIFHYFIAPSSSQRDEPDRLCPHQFKGAGPRPTPDGVCDLDVVPKVATAERRCTNTNI